MVFCVARVTTNKSLEKNLNSSVPKALHDRYLVLRVRVWLPRETLHRSLVDENLELKVWGTTWIDVLVLLLRLCQLSGTTEGSEPRLVSSERRLFCPQGL